MSDDPMDLRNKSGRMITGNSNINNGPFLSNQFNSNNMNRPINNNGSVIGMNNSLTASLGQSNKNYNQQQGFNSINNLNMISNNNMAMIAGLNQSSQSNSPLSNSNNNNNNNNNNQVQNQLIESFKMAVSLNLISPDLLNTKLPQDVLTLLYQLFQALNHYVQSTNKLQNLTKRKSQMSQAQFKIESDNLNQEITLLKENLMSLQNKINTAHILLKQQNIPNTSTSSSSSINPSKPSIQASSSSSNSGSSINPSLVPTPPGSAGLSNSNLLGNVSSLTGVTDTDLLMSTVNQLASKENLQKPKLLQLLSETSGSSNSTNINKLNPGINRQASQPVQSKFGGAPINQSQSFFPNFSTSQSNNFSNSASSQWTNMKPGDSLSPFIDQLPPLDDRITPFVPGQLWAGHGQSSIEDDPNCTPGSVSKPLLTETIDPESILTSLSKNSQWSNSLSTDTSLLLGGSLGSSSQSNQFSSGNSKSLRANSSWSSNGASNGLGFSSQLSLQNQNSMNGNSVVNGSTSIGEQLWGVKSVNSSNNNNNRLGNSAGGPNLNRNSTSFNNSTINNSNSGSNNNSMLMQHNQQFYRSNSWNVTPPQQQQQHNQLNNSQDSRSSNINSNNINSGNSISPMLISSGHFVLIRNVTPHIDQTTLRTLCAQHATGALTYFRYIPQMACVIVRYSSKDEANNAQNKLNSLPIGNTTLFTQSLNENDLK